MSGSKEKRNPDQLPLFDPPDENLTDLPPEDYAFDPEWRLAALHDAMQKRRPPRNKTVEADINRQVNNEMKKLFEIWGIPTQAQMNAELRESFQEAVSFLQTVPYRDTTVMKFLMTQETLTPDTIDELQALLSDRFNSFHDWNSSEEVAIHGNPTALLYDRATKPKSKRYRK